MSENDSVCSTGSSSDGDSIKVFIRVRPLVTEATDVDLGTCLEVDRDRRSVVMRSKSDPKVFTFDEVADKSVTQEGVFCSVGKKIIDGCVSGYNGTIFAYGQTGSGKTFTMLGPHEDTDNFQHELRGVIPRSFEYLFKLVKKEKEIHGDRLVFLCKCSFLEIYNEQIFDLLDTSTSSLQLRENIRRGVYVEGAQEQAVSSAHEAYQVLNRGWMNRTVASTTMNRESSRSHAVFTVSIESKMNENGVWNIKMSQLHLVDLAGSERQKDTNTTGQRLKEAGSINRSLSALGNVIMALVDVAHGKTRHIPYRDSKLSFLLRDSLGGNSKTYIVACVHPGSKCFGETLSTLHFARRAKMIKNKAVVNEDTQGSITHLQAEIKRLKETLLHYQQNSLANNPSTSSDGSGDGCLSPETSLNGPSAIRYRFFFLQAMLFRNKSETEKRLLLESLKKQQEVCNRKEQALRQMKMVLKFREDALRKIEKAQKEKLELNQDDKDDIIECLRSEVKTLQAVVDHHPEVVRYQIDNESLKAEIRHLRSEANNGRLDQQKTEELEKMFMELQAESGEAGKSSQTHQQQQVPNGNLTSATVERQKAQLAKVQTELETLRAEMAEELQRTQRELISKEAELMGTQKAKEELEKLFKAHQIRFQIERETRDDLHAETIKIMTTPKKGGRKMRNSIGPGSGNRALALTPEETPAGSDDDNMIGQEAPPVEWTEEQCDGLRDEISKLQDELRTLKVQLEEADRNMVNLVQDKSLLEAEKDLREKLHLKEAKSQEDKIFELAAEVTRLGKENSDYLTTEKILTSELQDLRIMNEAADRKLTEVRNEAKDYRSSKDREVAQFETELMKLNIELGKVKEDLELTSEERDQLQEIEETLQATLDFTSEQLKDTEEGMRTSKEEIKRLELSLKNSVAKVEEMEQDKEKLLVQLQQETGIKDQRLLEALETIKVLRSELQMHQSQLSADGEKISGLEQRVADLGAECERLLKADLKKEEVLSSMTSRVTELKSLLQERERTLEDVTIERKELRLRNYELGATCQNLEERLLQQTAMSNDATNKLQQVISAREVEYEMLQEDYQGAVSRVDNLGTQLNGELQRNSVLSEKQKMLDNEIVALKSEIERLHSQSNDYKSRLELTLNEKQELLEKDSEIAEHVAEKQLLHLRSVELEKKLSNLQEAFDVISSQLDVCKKDSVSTKMELEEEKRATERQKVISDEWQTKHQKLQLKVELERSEWLEKQEEVRLQLETMEANVSTAKTQAWQGLQDLAIENKDLRSSNQSLAACVTNKNSEIARLQDCANGVHEEMDKLNSRNEELQEELLRQKKIADKLEADLCVQLNENAKLSGHQNHLQKIAYLDRLKDQVIKLEKVGNDVDTRIGLSQILTKLNELRQVVCGCDVEATVPASCGALVAAASAQSFPAEILPEVESFLPVCESFSNLLPSVGNFSDNGIQESLSIQNLVCKTSDACNNFDEAGTSQRFSSSLIMPEVCKAIGVGSLDIREWMELHQLNLSPCVFGPDRQPLNQTLSDGCGLAQKLIYELNPSESGSPGIEHSSPKLLSHFLVTKPTLCSKAKRSFLEITLDNSSIGDLHSYSQANKNKVCRQPVSNKSPCNKSPCNKSPCNKFPCHSPRSLWKNSRTKEILSAKISESNALQSVNLFEDFSDADESLHRSGSCLQDAKKCNTDNVKSTITSTFQCILKREPEPPTVCNEPTLESLMDKWPRSEVAKSRARRLLLKTISKAKSSRAQQCPSSAKESPPSERRVIL